MIEEEKGREGNGHQASVKDYALTGKKSRKITKREGEEEKG